MIISAIVLTNNEEINIRDCLSFLSWTDERLVVDSGSTDATPEIAGQCGARVIRHPMKDFADQRNFALENAKGDWIFFVDADERVTEELANEIINIILSSKENNKQKLYAYAIPRQNYFFGKPLRFGDSQGDAPIRFFPREKARWIQPVHEKLETDLPIRSLKGKLLHYSTRDLAHYLEKVRRYVPLEVETLRSKGVRPGLLKMILVPPAKFLYLFFWKLGILDGIPGLQYAILSSYYSFKKHWRFLRQR